MSDTRSHESQETGRGRAEGLRFAVITDAHVEHPADVRVEYLRAALDSVKKHQPAFVVFAGDLVSPRATTTPCGGGRVHAHPTGDTITTQAAETESASWVLDLFASMDVPVHQLRGNVDVPIWQEPLRFAFDSGPYAFIGFDTAMGTLDESEDRWLQQTLERFGDNSIVCFSHYYAGALEPAAADRLLARLASARVTDFISGHGHRCEQHTVGQTRHHLVEAVDPFKPGSHRPGYELFEVDDTGLHRTHHAISLVTPNATSRFLDCLGCAPGDPSDASAFTGLLTECGLRHAQCKLKDDVLRALGADAAVPNLRRRLDDGTLQALSLHGATPEIDGEANWLNQSTINREIEICRESGAVSVTTHLPTRDDRALFDPHGGSPTPLADKLADALALGFSGYWKSGIRIDLENTHWQDPSQYPGSLGEHQLGIRINHLLWFREQLEARLIERCGNVDGAGVGFCFDVGHALTNGPLASTFTIPDWFASLGPHIRTIHFHDTVDLPGGGRQAHFPIGVTGGLLGLEGLAHLWNRYSPDAILYLEVETLEDVRQSMTHLRQWQCRVSDRP